jgi:hypothetical protein
MVSTADSGSTVLEEAVAGDAWYEPATVSFRCSVENAADVRPWSSADVESLGAASPWRTFRWHKGQKHYSGTFWAATNRDHVIYESRLELARLLFADFDRSVQRIVAQPFLLKDHVAGFLRKYIPDYLLLTDSGPLIVDVKPRARLAKPMNVATFAWTRDLVESRGWRYEVWSEPSSVELENVRFLAGYRRDWLFDQEVLAELRVADIDGATLSLAFRSLPRKPEPLVRSAMLHLLWRQHFVVDLTRPLSAAHVLRRTV